jgi:signal transduction histidine kinase/outer membrane lipoprotein-sorting protein
MPRSLGARSILAASLAILLALVVVGGGVDILVARHLHRSLDRSLRTRAVDVAQLSASAPALLTSPGALDAPVGGPQLSTQVVDRRGRIVARSLALGGRVLPVERFVEGVIATGHGRYGDARLASGHLRVYVAPLADSGGRAAGGAVAVAASTHDLEETLDSVQLFVLVAALAAAAAAAAVLAVLMRRALAPLGRLTYAAAEIERTGDRHRRLPQPETDDEIGRLARTLNGMLGSLERAGEAERRFVADASHELRTPLTALVGNVSYLARYGASDELVAELEQDARRLAKLADDLLALSREEAAAPPDELVSLDELAHGVEGVGVAATDGVCVRGDRAALERALHNLVENARRHGRGRITVEAAARDGLALLTVADEGPGLSPEEAEHAFGRFWRGRDPGPRLRPRPGACPRYRRTPRRPRLRRRGAFHDRASPSHGHLRVGGYNYRRGARERSAVSRLRTLSTRNLFVLVVAVLCLVGGGTAIAVAAGDAGPTPPPKPLDQAIQDALAAKHPDGLTARVTFTNKLFPSGALAGRVGSALMSGASGRLWLTDDGRGRIELQSDAGDVQIVWNSTTVTIYDASSNTVYRATLPAGTDRSTSDTSAPPTLAEIDKVLADLGVHWAISTAQPTNVAGQEAYSVSASPKHDGGLLGSIELAWDAVQGTPLRAGIYAQGSASPVLELAVTDISYGSVPSDDVDVSPPAGAKVVDLTSDLNRDKGSGTPAVTGLEAVRAASGFPVLAPDSLVGLPRRDVCLVGGKNVLVFYGEGLGGIALVERKADESGSASQLSGLPSVSLDGLTAHELATQLGTVLEWQSGGTSYVLAGSLPPAAAEAAARALK